MKYDVLIVGGGPAGSMAAIQLMGNGLRVAILDRAQFPRIKPCGGGISCRAYRRFAKLEHVLKSVPTNLVHKLVFESPSGDAVEFSSDGPLYAMIRRLEFDNALLNHCKAGGIEVREDVTVSRVEVVADGVRLTSTANEEFFADLVIGADGVNSTVAVQTGMRGPWRQNQIAIDGTEESPRTSLNVNQDTMYVYYGYGGGYGYGYLFPKASHVNVGVGYFLEYYKRDVSQKPYVQHLDFLDHLKTTKVLSGQSQRDNFHAYVLPVGGPLERISRDRILLAGDAAGFVNGFTAEGIYYAMVSGEHAGQAALDAIRNGDVRAEFLRRHDRACEAEIGPELRKSVNLQKRLFANPALIDSVVRFAKRNATARSLLARFGVGEISYEELKRRTVTEALPGYLRYQFEKMWRKATRFSATALQTRRS
jgi:geranylgeranyl reductase family protein